MEFRAFATAKAMYDRAETEKDIPKTPIFQLVRALDFERVAADRQARLDRAAQTEHENG